MVADALTRRLTDELAKHLGVPLKDGWSFQVNPAEQSVSLGWRMSW